MESATRDYDLVTPEEWSRRAEVVGGIDWGFSQDANALVIIAGGQPDEAGVLREVPRPLDVLAEVDPNPGVGEVGAE